MKRILINIIRYASWTHEVFHLVPAWFLRVPIQAFPDHVIYDLDDDWKTLLIALGPLIAALLILVGVA
jgi:hypothetical protein